MLELRARGVDSTATAMGVAAGWRPKTCDAWLMGAIISFGTVQAGVVSGASGTAKRDTPG